jgi:hypothetical protein
LFARHVWLIVVPRVVIDSIGDRATRQLSGRPALVPRIFRGPADWLVGPPRRGDEAFAFPSSHPSYALVDGLNAGLLGIMLSAIPADVDPCVYASDRAQLVIGVALLVGLIVLRHVSHVLLGRRLADEAYATAWVPTLMFLGFLTLVVAAALLLPRLVVE